jgi:hypothetical protein
MYVDKGILHSNSSLYVGVVRDLWVFRGLDVLDTLSV